MSLVEKLFGSFSDRELKKVNPITKQVLALEPKYQAMSDADLQAQTAMFKQQLAEGKTLDDLLPDAFAVCREAAWRVLGMKHFPVQVTGGIALHRGDIAEMQTGEGKTLVATLPAYLNALTGEGVHIVTVNDYLAKRDSEWMGKLYRWLGLTVGLIVQGMDGDARRAGRQGDPGASRFYLSLEDDLMRLFGGDRVSSLMNTLKIDEDTPIENRMITNTLESAQKKLEGRNFEIRKNVLKYDDVMNQQREIIYGQRRKVLDGEDISTEMHKMLRENIDSSCAQFLSGDVKDEWDFGALRRHYQGWLTTDADFHYTVADFDNLSQQGIADMLYDRGMQILQAKEVRYGAPVMRELERICLLKCVDRQWMDHIDNMDQLRQGIALRGYGQKDPVVEYRIEGFDMFDQMVDSIRESSVKMLLTIELRAAGSAPKREQVAKPTGEGYVPGNGAPGAKGAPKGQPVRVIKIGRNDPCPCGSGLKWKKCTCAKYHPEGSHTEG